MYEKIAKTAVTVGVVLLALLAVAFSAWGLYQSTNVAKVLNQQVGYQRCITDVNNQMAQQQAAQQQTNPEPQNEE